MPSRKLNPILILSGGGLVADRVCARLLARSLPKSKRLLYIPVAMRHGPRSFGECWDWAYSLYRKVDISRIDMWTDLEGRHFSELAPYGAVLFGGGNTFELVAEVRRSGFLGLLSRFLASGGIYAGGSAGAILAGADIRTASLCGDKNEIRIRQFEGLGLLRDWSIAAHYTHGMRDELLSRARSLRLKILALSGNCAVHVSDGQITTFGAPAITVTTAGKFSNSPETLWTFTKVKGTRK
jgi:dipeptidase E